MRLASIAVAVTVNCLLGTVDCLLGTMDCELGTVGQWWLLYSGKGKPWRGEVQVPGTVAQPPGALPHCKVPL